MLFAYAHDQGRLTVLDPSADLAQALWIDLYRPQHDEAARVAALGVEVPTLEDMEEIEISNRLFREGGTDCITVVLPGLSETKMPLSGPVTFLLTAQRLITIRHHAPRPFETYPPRADKTGPGCATPDALFLGLMEEVIGRLADLLEGSGRAMEEVTRAIYADDKVQRTAPALQASLVKVGRESDLIARVRLSLLTLERAVGFFSTRLVDKRAEVLRLAAKGIMRDIAALEVHGDYLTTRVAQATDATLGLINLLQNGTVKIVSVVAVLFLPPTLIASVYGMNFQAMPELAQPWGYPMAIGLMVGSAAITWAVFRWQKWL